MTRPSALGWGWVLLKRSKLASEEHSHKCVARMLPKASLASVIKEEISLEGLEGSTLDTLWNRVAVRLEMSMPLPQELANTIWSMVLRNPEFEFYCLREARKPFVWFDRLANVDPETGTPVHPSEYPGHRFRYNPVEANGVRGSCEEYHTRTRITLENLLPISCTEADEKYEKKLVIVASQRMRESFLIAPNCTHELTLIQYCMLEWIGRSRFNGETSHGKFSLLDVVGESSTLFYNRKALSNARLITRQNLSMRMDDSSTQGMVFHLPRYYNEMKSKQVLLVERVVTELKRRKNCIADYEEMKVMLLGRSDAGKIFRSPEFQRYVKTDELVPYQEFYPEATASERRTKRGEERMVRIMRLIDPNADLQQDREGPDEIEVKDKFLMKADSSSLYVDLSLFRQAYKVVAMNGETGISQTELATALGLDRLTARGLVKNLIKLKIFESQSVDEGRQRMAKYFLAGRARHSLVFDKELTQFVTNREEAIETQRQQREAEEGFQSSLVQLLSDADSLVDTYSTMCSSNVAPLTATISAATLAAIEEIKNDVHDGICVNVVLSDKLEHQQKAESGIVEAMKSKSVSALVLRRCNFIIACVKREMVIEPRIILTRLNCDERAKGHKYEACQKSLLRLISRLAADRLMMFAIVTMQRDKREYRHIFVCDPKVTTDPTAIRTKVADIRSRISMQSISDVREAAKIGDTSSTSSSKGSKEVRDSSGSLPKCLRMMLFHEFLFYLVYEQRRDTHELAVSELQAVDLVGLALDEYSPVYSDTNDWKMFVPPLKHSTHGDGWILLNDVFVRMPLFVFCSICAFASQTADLAHYLDHPIRRYYLIKHLPATIRGQLLSKRRYVHAILDTAKLLCYSGLIQMGPKLAKERDQTLVYVNRTTQLLDTTVSRPGYNEIEEREYTPLPFRFETLEHVKEYWKKLYEVSIATRINTRSTAIGKEILTQHLNAKPAMIAALRPQTPETALANDSTQLPPGDRKGAAGMDTAMFMHLTLNWHKLINYKIPIDRHRLKCVRKAMLARKPFGGATAIVKAPGGKQLTLKKPGGSSLVAVAGRGVTILGRLSKTKISKRRDVKKRIIKPPKSTLPQQKLSCGYDEVDRCALKLMNKLRVKWTPFEDHLLLLCRVALFYFYGKSSNTLCPVNSTIFRDILHWSNTRSQSKTSRACQRRLNYMVTKMYGYDNQARTLLEECKLDAQIDARFGPDFVRKLREHITKQDDYIIAVRIHFVQLVHHLRCRFSRQQPGERQGSSIPPTMLPLQRPRKRSLPDSLEEFYSQYNVIETSGSSSRINYAIDPSTAEELARYKLTIVMHSAIVTRRSITDVPLQSILERHVGSTVNGAMRLLRDFQLVSVSNGITKQAAKINISSSTIAGYNRVYHLSITYHQQLITAIPFDLFVPLFGQMARLVGRDRYEQERFDCEDGGDSMALLLIELVAVGQVELGIEQAADYIAMRPDAIKGHSDVIMQLYGQGYTEVLGESSKGATPAPASSTTGKGPRTKEGVPKSTGSCKAPPRKKAKKQKGRSVACTGKGLKHTNFSTDKDISYHYLMHPAERLLKLPIENFHFFCILEHLKVAGPQHSQRLLAQTFKIDELHPTECSLARCIVKLDHRKSGGDELLTECLRLAREGRSQLKRIQEQGALAQKAGSTARQNRIDTTQFFDVREDNLVLFFGKYIDAFQLNAGKLHRQDVSYRQQKQSGLVRTPVNMADLIVDCLACEDDTLASDWFNRCEISNALDIVDVDDDDEGEVEDDQREGSERNDDLSALSEKVFKLHNFFEVTSKKIYVNVRTPPCLEDQATGPERETYGQWQIPCAFLSEGAKQRREILLKIASEAIWPPFDELVPLMDEAMTLIDRNPRARALLEFIEGKQKLGATVAELAVAFPNQSELEKHLRTLQNLKFLLRTGLRNVTYVHWRYADEWLTKSRLPTPVEQTDQPADPLSGPSGKKRKTSVSHSCREGNISSPKKVKLEAYEDLEIEALPLAAYEDTAVEEEEKAGKYIQIAMAPWIQIDGTLNKRLLYRWLSALLLYSVSHPGVPFSVLTTRFNMMSPFHLRKLLEILQEYGCITLHSIQSNKTRTVFSTYKPVKIVPVTEFVPDEQTYIEVVPNAMNILSLCIGEYRKHAEELYRCTPLQRTKRKTIERLEEEESGTMEA